MGQIIETNWKIKLFTEKNYLKCRYYYKTKEMCQAKIF